MIISSRYLSEVVWWHNVNVSARPELVTFPPLVGLFIIIIMMLIVIMMMILVLMVIIMKS